MKRMSLLIWALLMAAPLFAQTAQKFTVEFQAGMIMKAGNVWKLPRHDFFLMNRALTTAEVEAIMFRFNVERIKARLTETETTLIFPGFLCKEPDTADKSLCQRLQADAVNIVTDFESAGTFTVPRGTYYLVGHAATGLSQAVWNVRIVVDRNQKLILDNRNAAAIKDAQPDR